jgi:hypothetical protein
VGRVFQERLPEHNQKSLRRRNIVAFDCGLTPIRPRARIAPVPPAQAASPSAPQWQIEALRRLEIPEEMQKKYGFKPMSAADGPVKRAIFDENSARLYKYDRRAELATDRITLAKADYEKWGDGRTNRRYGYIAKPWRNRAGP